jgi:hypothetical protein
MRRIISSIRSTGREPLLLNTNNQRAPRESCLQDLHGSRQIGAPVGGCWGREADAAWHVLLKSVAGSCKKLASAGVSLAYHILETS